MFKWKGTNEQTMNCITGYTEKIQMEQPRPHYEMESGDIYTYFDNYDIKIYEFVKGNLLFA